MPETRQRSLLYIRSTRAQPPGTAASTPGLRATYGAALQQFDELLTASSAAGHAARPLTLFYALSQAARAITAAHGGEEEIGAHGLAEDRSATAHPTDLLLRRIRRRPARHDALSAVCGALGHPDPFGTHPRPMELGAAWAAIPRLNAYLPRWEERWRPALRAMNDVPIHEPPQHVMSLRASISAPDASTELNIDAYPSLPRDFAFEPADIEGVFTPPGERRLGKVIWGPAESTPSAFDLTHLAGDGSADLWLMPAARGSDGAFVPLTAWWVLLFALSIFARYHPGLWGEALNVDGSTYAIPLQLMLDEAFNELPILVADALHKGGG